MNMKTLTILSLVFATSGAMAQTSVPNEFTSGTAAQAEEVNANFAALASAIDTLAGRVTELENAANATPTADVVGSTYSFNSTEIGFASSNGNFGFARTDLCLNFGTITFNANGTASLSQDDDCTELVFSLGFDGQNSVPASNTQDLTPEPGSASVPFTLSGNQVTLNTENPIVFTISDGGNLLIAQDMVAMDEPDNGPSANARLLRLTIAARSE